MPKESDFVSMQKWHQNVYIISDSDDIAGTACEKYIEMLFARFRGEAEIHEEIAFNLYCAVFRDETAWGIREFVDIGAEASEGLPVLPEIENHAHTMWEALSQGICDTYREDRRKGLSHYVPIFIFFVSRNETLAMLEENALSDNAYFRCANSEGRKILFIEDSVWNGAIRIDSNGTPWEMEPFFPYSLFGEEVLSYVLRIPRGYYQTGEREAGLVALRRNAAQSESGNDCADGTDDPSVWEW